MISAKWDVTSRCNLRCKHCSVAQMYFEGACYPELGSADRLRIVDALAAGGVGHLSLLGGEPLILGDQLFAVLARAKARGLDVSIVTNGTLLSAEVSQRLIDAGLDRLIVSLEGSDSETHDQVRGRGTFNKVVTHLGRFLSLRDRSSRQWPGLTINTVLTRVNCGRFAEMIPFCRDLGADEWNALSLNFVGNADHNLTSLAVPKSEHTRVAHEIGKLLSSPGFDMGRLRINLQLTYPLVWEYLCKRYGLSIPQPQICCSASSSLAYISPNGDVHLCDRVHGSEYSGCRLGSEIIRPVSLLTSTFQDVWTSQQYKEMFSFVRRRETYAAYVPCNRCKYLSNGVCNPCPLYYFNGSEIRFEECLRAEEYLDNITSGVDESITEWERAHRFGRLPVADVSSDRYASIVRSCPAQVRGVRSVSDDGYTILVHPRSAEEVRLNAIASEIWNSMNGETALEDVVANALELYRSVYRALQRVPSEKEIDQGLETIKSVIFTLHERQFVEFSQV